MFPMKMITYAGAKLMTGDDIAVAVLEHSAALAEENTAETVEIPILKADGSRSTASILVGPASQIVAENVETDFDELLDPETVERLKARTRALRPGIQAGAADQDPTTDFDSWSDGI